MVVDPSQTSSEFAFPKRVVSQVAKIRQEFLQPLRTKLAEASAIRDDRLRVLREELDLAQAAFEKRKADALAKRKLEEDKAQSQLGALAKLTAEADALLRNFGLEPSPTQSLDPDVTVESLAKVVVALSGRKRPALLPDGGDAWAGVIIGSLVGSFVFPPLILSWPAFALARRQFWDSGARNSHSIVQGGAEVLREKFASAIETSRSASQSAIDTAKRSILDPATKVHDAERQIAQTLYENTLRQLEDGFRALSLKLSQECSNLRAESSFAGADWTASIWDHWQPDDSPEFGGRLGTLLFDAADLEQSLPNLAHSTGQQGLKFPLPAMVPFASGRCLLLSAPPTSRRVASEALRSLLMRCLATTPAGKARFTFIDPIGMGQNVAEFIALGDATPELIAGKAWAEPRHISDQLSELSGQIETVIQKYLRNEFSTILDYNSAAQEVAEPFRFLVVFDFPANFSDESLRRIVSIARTGPRCGVFTLILRDLSKPTPHGFSIDDLAQLAVLLTWDADGVARWGDAIIGADTRVIADSAAATSELSKRIVRIAAERSEQAMKVEVPFARIMETAAIFGDGLWKESTARRLSVPIGPMGAKRLQSLSLGEGLAHHGLVIGRTGSGKTNLLHVIIAGLALKYSPEELQLYLVDFKGGVGFKPYAVQELPHAAVIAIESEREFGISVLEGLDATMRQRAELFRRSAVDNLGDYRARNPESPMPRVLLIVDEYQELFSPRDDSTARLALQLIERIVRQGRSFGMHILMGSQSLSGNAQLPPAILGQLAVRVALPCNDVDARSIFAEDNTAARSLTRSGEAIYNSGAGAVEANSPFQVALFGDGDLRATLSTVDALARGVRRPKPIIFEGSEPADFADSVALAALRRAGTWSRPASAKIWLGEPVAIQPPVHAVMDRRPGRHLLIVDRDEEQAVSVLHSAWISLMCQHAPADAQFYVLDFSSADTQWSNRSSDYRQIFDHQIEAIGRRETAELLAELAKKTEDHDLHKRSGIAPIYLIVQGLHRARDLRWSAEFAYRPATVGTTPIEDLLTVLQHGPEAHIHVLAWCDTYSNAKRSVDRRIEEFGLRVVGAMSADDSRSLIDSPDGSRLDRPHRMLFSDEERPGSIQKFRPYSLAPLDWLGEVTAEHRKWR